MIQICFGNLGFHANKGTVKGYDKDAANTHVWLLFFGVFGVIWWNNEAAKMIYRVMRLSVDDAALIADARKIISARVEAKIGEELKTRDEIEERNRAEYWSLRQTTDTEKQQLHTEIHELKSAIRVIAGMQTEAGSESQI